MGMALKIDLSEVYKEDKRTRVWSPTSRALFDFSPARHQEALDLSLGDYFRNRLPRIYRDKPTPSPHSFGLWAEDTHLVVSTNNIVHHIAGLYWLEHCRATLSGPKLEKIQQLFEVQLSLISEVVSNYTLAICMGEFRHGFNNSWLGAKCKKCKYIFNNIYPNAHENNYSRDFASTNIWYLVKKFPTPTYGALFDLLIHGFCDHSWGGPTTGCGGPKWGYIVYMGRDLFCAWAEGDITAMMKYLDFIIHSVHNGGSAMYGKFNWFPIMTQELFLILNAKFNGKPCCWSKIASFIPELYLLEKIPKVTTTCHCPSKNFAISKEETEFCTTFTPFDRCSSCGTYFVGAQTQCAKWCERCGKCFEVNNHIHACSVCAAEISDPDHGVCPNSCEECSRRQLVNIFGSYDAYTQYENPIAKRSYQVAHMQCVKGLALHEHRFCHWCWTNNNVVNKTHIMCENLHKHFCQTQKICLQCSTGKVYAGNQPEPAQEVVTSVSTLLSGLTSGLLPGWSPTPLALDQIFVPVPKYKPPTVMKKKSALKKLIVK